MNKQNEFMAKAMKNIFTKKQLDDPLLYKYVENISELINIYPVVSIRTPLFVEFVKKLLSLLEEFYKQQLLDEYTDGYQEKNVDSFH